MRPIEEWADRVYTVLADVAHIKPWGDGSALCGLFDTVWLGTGDWDEIETAMHLAPCRTCHQRIDELVRRDPAVTIWQEAVRADA